MVFHAADSLTMTTFAKLWLRVLQIPLEFHELQKAGVDVKDMYVVKILPTCVSVTGGGGRLRWS